MATSCGLVVLRKHWNPERRSSADHQMEVCGHQVGDPGLWTGLLGGEYVSLFKRCLHPPLSILTLLVQQHHYQIQVSKTQVTQLKLHLVRRAKSEHRCVCVCVCKSIPPEWPSHWRLQETRVASSPGRPQSMQYKVGLHLGFVWGSPSTQEKDLC